MAITDNYTRLKCADIKIDREKRQRKVIKTEDIKESIQLYGVLNPIIVDNDGTLVAGERRLTASLELGLETIPVRYLDSLSAQESQIIELEENLKRSDLTWKESVLATAKIHSIYVERDKDWTQQKTADVLSLSNSHLGVILKVSRNFSTPRVEDAPTLQAAVNIINRIEERAIGDAMSDIQENTSVLFAPKPKIVLDDLGVAIPQPKVAPGEKPKTVKDIPILLEDFTKWAPTYSGPRFNFIHCDFPYGINLDKGGDMSGKNSMALYDDSPDVYWDLCHVLCKNLDNIMSTSGHLMFWYSMNFHQETLDFFAKHAPSLVFNPFPLIWVKSDNIGLLPDPKRGPRRIYETCLMASREDRPIVKAVSNAYSAPTDRQYHPSTKPEPVLRHFFQMFVDQSTRILDPTCGSGSSLRAAESMGAESVLGFEREPEHHESAVQAYRKFRILRGA